MSGLTLERWVKTGTRGVGCHKGRPREYTSGPAAYAPGVTVKGLCDMSHYD